MGRWWGRGRVKLERERKREEKRQARGRLEFRCMRLGSSPDTLDGVGLACVLEVVGKGLVSYPWSPGFQGEKSWLPLTFWEVT